MTEAYRLYLKRHDGEDPLSKLLINGVTTYLSMDGKMVEGATFYCPKETVTLISIKMHKREDGVIDYIVKLSDGKERDLIYDFQVTTVNVVIERIKEIHTEMTEDYRAFLEYYNFQEPLDKILKDVDDGLSLVNDEGGVISHPIINVAREIEMVHIKRVQKKDQVRYIVTLSDGSELNLIIDVSFSGVRQVIERLQELTGGK